jgi:hypothetical protein
MAGAMDKHLTVLGVLYIVLSALGLLVAGLIFLAIVGGGLLSGDPRTMSIGFAIGVLAAGFAAMVSAPGLVAGIGLLRRAHWARILALIVAAINLINIPIGTALGAYAIWVLVQDDSIRLLGEPRAATSSATA